MPKILPALVGPRRDTGQHMTLCPHLFHASVVDQALFHGTILLYFRLSYSKHVRRKSSSGLTTILFLSGDLMFLIYSYR